MSFIFSISKKIYYFNERCKEHFTQFLAYDSIIHIATMRKQKPYNLDGFIEQFGGKVYKKLENKIV